MNSKSLSPAAAAWVVCRAELASFARRPLERRIYCLVLLMVSASVLLVVPIAGRAAAVAWLVGLIVFGGLTAWLVETVLFAQQRTWAVARGSVVAVARTTPTRAGRVRVASVAAIPQGRGGGTQLMSRICEWADKNNVELELRPSTPRVASWYRDLGFTPNSNWQLERPPARISQHESPINS